MKNRNLVFILGVMILLAGCQGLETDQLGDISSTGEEVEDNGGLATEPIEENNAAADNGSPSAPDEEVVTPVPEEEVDMVEDDGQSFRCVKSAFHQPNFVQPQFFEKASCTRASSRQKAQVDLGNTKAKKFLNRCYRETGNSCWCNQMIRPNPSSINTFKCTYGSNQTHQLVHPDESTWKHPIAAVNLVRDLERQGIRIQIIYNWWRPEPYNKNVGGSPTRHPFGTAIDVRFTSKSHQLRAHKQLCKWRKQGRLRALGYYSSPALHFGVGDRNGNTWGKGC